MQKLKEAIMNMPPKTKQAALISTIVLGVVGISWIANSGSDSSGSSKRKQTEVKSVLTDTSTREVGLESLAAEIKRLQKQNAEMSRRLDRMLNKQEQTEAVVTQASKLANLIENTNARIEALEKRFAEQESVVEMLKNKIDAGLVGGAGVDNAGPVAVELGPDGKPIKKLPDRNEKGGKAGEQAGTEEESSSPQNQAVKYFQQAPLPGENDQPEQPEPVSQDQKRRSPVDIAPDAAPDKKNGAPSQPVAIRVVKASSTIKKEAEKESGEVAYLPSGTIITGVLLNGMDAPTSESARKNPFPSLLRIQKEAILPNYRKSDIRECFAIVSGYGDMSSERAYLRAESISCVRDDESILESSLSAYAVGEDGKVGVRGRLVSKQGQIIAKSLMAGFLSGVSEAFNMQPVPAINTNPGNAVSYQSLLTPETFQSGVASGASKALDRIAQFYLDMADNIFPVIEVDAGRKVELIVSKGTRISLRNKKSAAGKSGKK